MTPLTKTTRRNMLAGTAALAAAPAALSTRPAQAMLDVMAPDKKMEVYRRMRGRNDGELALWWWNGFVWAKPIDDIAVHILSVEGLTFQRLTTNPDGTLTSLQAGRGTFRDAETNAPLTTWTNPINGVTAEPDHVRSYNKAIISNAGMEREHSDRILKFESWITAPIITGNQVFMRENFVGMAKGREPGTTSSSSSLTTYTANTADIANDDAAFRPCNFNYQSLGGFRPWMGMDNDKGMLSWQTVGQKLARGPADAPDDIKGWVEDNYPGFLDDPEI